MNYLDKKGITKLWEVRGRKDGGAKDMGLSAKHKIFPTLPHLSIFPVTQSILTNTSFTPATDQPNNKPTLPSSPLFLYSAIHSSVSSMPSIIPNNLPLSPTNSPQCNKKCTISSTTPSSHSSHLPSSPKSPTDTVFNLNLSLTYPFFQIASHTFHVQTLL